MVSQKEQIFFWKTNFWCTLIGALFLIVILITSVKYYQKENQELKARITAEEFYCGTFTEIHTYYCENSDYLFEGFWNTTIENMTCVRRGFNKSCEVKT